MKEKLIVFNTTNTNISLVIFPSMYNIDVSGLAQHHSRRRIRASKINVSVPRAQSVDLVAVTNISIEEIKNSPDLNVRLRSGALRILEETHVIDLDDDDIEIIEDPIPEAPVVAKSLDNFNSLMEALSKEKAEPVEKIVEVIEETGNLEVEVEVKPEVKSPPVFNAKKKKKRSKNSKKKG